MVVRGRNDDIAWRIVMCLPLDFAARASLHAK